MVANGARANVRIGTIVAGGEFTHDMTVDHRVATRLALVLGATVLTIAPPYKAGARAASGTPIRLLSCSTTQALSARPRTEAPRFGMIVSYAVLRSADVVRFTTATPSGDVRTYTASGLFSPGVVIANRHLTADAFDPTAAEMSSPTRCAPTYVHFLDGTSWSATQ